MPGSSPPRTEIPRLAGVELLGQYDGAGTTEARYLIRRADGRLLEVSPVLYAVAMHIDGERDVAAVASAATRTIGRRVSADNVAYLIQHKLGPIGVVTGDANPSPHRAAPVLTLGLRRTLLGKRAAGAAASALRPLFRPAVVVSVLAALVAVDAWLLATEDLAGSVELVIDRPELLLVVWVVMALGGIVHELGHATATRYGGATPGPIGVGIYLLWPAFYNDLNDSYRLSRSGRLRADLGGVYFNCVFILALAGVYALTGAEPLLVVIAWQHLTIGQQFLPFVRLDGYYVLSDAIGVPDLFAPIKPVLASLVPGRSPDASVSALKRSARAAVACWALVTVPVLAASIVLLALRLPHVVQVAHHSIVRHGAGLSESVRHGRVWLALLGAIQVTVLTVPFAGAALVVVRLLRLCALRKTPRQAASIRTGAPCQPPLARARMNRVMAFSSSPGDRDVPALASLGLGDQRPS